MGIFFDESTFSNPIETLNEFEADGKKLTNDEDDEYKVDGDEPNDQPEDDGDEIPEGDEPESTDEGDDEYELEGDEPTDEQPEDDEGDEPTDEGDDEYTLTDDEGEDGDETGTEDDTTEGDEPTDDGPSEEDTNSKLKQLEGELFDQLSPEQQKIKISELKKCYQELHERCDTLIELLNDVSAPDENSYKVFEYLNDNLSDLKQYIYDYFTYTFETKTYIENSAQYQKYIALLSSLNGILEELKKSTKE